MSYELFNSQPDAVSVPPWGTQGETDEEYLVEVITKARYKLCEADAVTHTGSKTIPGEWEYYVKWFGYPDNENTWQSWESLVGNCARLLKEFWDEFDFDELKVEDIMDGIVEPSQEWIEYQKDYSNKYDIVPMPEDAVKDTSTAQASTLVVEEEIDSQKECGSSSEEEDDDDNDIDEDEEAGDNVIDPDEEVGNNDIDADEEADDNDIDQGEDEEENDIDEVEDSLAWTRERLDQAMCIPSQEHCDDTSEMLDQREFYQQNAYPSPMSSDNDDI